MQLIAAGVAFPAGLQLPAQAHEVLRALLRRLWDARRCEPVRLPLTGALLEYLQLSRGPRLLRLPPPVLQAVLKGTFWRARRNPQAQ